MTSKYENTGPYVYIFNLLKNLAKIDNTNEYVVYVCKENNIDKPFEEISGGNPRWSYKILSKQDTKVFKFLSPKLKSWSQMALAEELVKNPVDVFFSSSHTLPGFAFLLSPFKFKAVSMIHGLEYKSNQIYKNKPLHLILHPLVLLWVTLTSKHIIVPSAATKDELLKRWRLFIKEKKISVINEGIKDSFYKRGDEEIKEIKRKYNLDDYRYLLMVATIQPRKNIPRLVNAFSMVKNKLNQELLKLVIVGKNGWGFEESLKSPEKFNVQKDVIFLRGVNDQDLAPLLSGAAALVNSSIEEGFGLPLLEAMSCNVPPIVSNIPAFREVGKDTVTYFNPLDVSDIYEKILNFLMSPINEMKIIEAKDISKNYTWEKTAQNTLNIIEHV